MNLSLRVLRFVKIKDTPRLHYSRWTHRRPIAVINLEDESKGIKRNRMRNIQRPSTQIKLDENSEAESTIDVTRNQKKLEYKTIEKDDPGFIKLMMTVKHRVSKKKQSDLILLEGIRLIQDAIDAKVNMQTLLFSRLSDVMKLSLPDNVQLFKLPYKSLQLWSNLTTSPGIMGVFEKPNVENREPVPESIPLTIICDNVREPGNLGSILRAAAGVGCRRVILMKGCVDLWDSKVLRGGAGAHFRIPIHPNRTWNEMFSLLNQNTSIFIADSNTNFESSSEVDTSEAMELNLDELDLDSNKSERLSKKIKALVQNLTSRIPVVPYYAVDYTDNDDTVLVVSGETECLSLESFDVFDKNSAVRVNIPLINGVDSLNNSVAFGIVAYEVKRQLLMKKSVIK